MSMLVRQLARKRPPCLYCARLASTSAVAIKSPQHSVDGRRVEALNTDVADNVDNLNPATGETLCVVRSANSDDVNRAVQSAKNAFPAWSELSGQQRGQRLLKAAQLIRENADELTRAEVLDSGKVLWEARFDVEGCADAIEYYGGLAASITGEYIQLANDSFGYTRREPIGICGGIGAWNFPFQMASWKSGPALAAGNTMVFKPSPLTPLTAVMLADIYTDAGIPPGCFNVVQGGAEIGELLSNHPDIGKMSFTGSVPTGSKVMAVCAKDIKRVTLELGGKSPLLIFDDCDIENAVKGAMCANFNMQGQVCSNGTRVFVQKSIMSTFLDKLVERTKRMKIGNPLQEDTLVGAVISKEQAYKVLGYIKGAQKEGARVLCGGELVTPEPGLAGGHFMSPCILVDVHDDMTVVREEIFGAVMTVLPFDNEEEVLARANNTHFGLAGGVFTKDLTRAHRVASKIQAGSLYINNYNLLPIGLPFGGFKQSGLGMENGRITLDYYTQVKAVYVEMGDVDCPF